MPLEDSFSLRDADVSDAYAIARVHVETWKVAYRGLVPESFFDGLSIKSREGMWRKLLSKGKSRITVAEIARTVVGFVDYGKCRDDDRSAPYQAEIFAVYVLPPYWSKRIGYALCTQACNDLHSAGYGEVSLWVLATNTRAKFFYQRFGFVADGASKLERVGSAIVTEERYLEGLPFKRKK